MYKTTTKTSKEKTEWLIEKRLLVVMDLKQSVSINVNNSHLMYTEA